MYQAMATAANGHEPSGIEEQATVPVFLVMNLGCRVGAYFTTRVIL